MSDQNLTLVDTFGRVHDNLRISVTDRCNLRCFYCMPADNPDFLPRQEILSFEEIDKLARLFVRLGVRKIRLTGGEPLVRKDLVELVQMLVAIPGVEDIGLTTNGLQLADQAQPLYRAGLRRLNVSLDALDPIRFRKFTRREGYEAVRKGIEVAQQVGFTPIKINAVSVKGLTEQEIVPFAHLARETGLEVRFIEYMPLDAENLWERERVLFAADILARLSSEIMPLIPRNSEQSHSPATEFQFADGIGTISVIASVSQPFCESCNRLRLTADGKMRNCLFSLEETDLRALIRGNATDEQIVQAILSCVHAKKEGHEINTSRFLQPDRPMHSIGG